MAGNATNIRQQKENAFNQALKDDPERKNESTRTLEADYKAARSKELNQTGQNEQARSYF